MRNAMVFFLAFFYLQGYSQSHSSPENLPGEPELEPLMVNTLSEADSLQDEIKVYIWGQNTGGENSSVVFSEHIDLRKDLGKDFEDLDNMASADKLLIHLKNNFISNVYILHPKKSNHLNIPIIYHSGHNIVFFHEDRSVNDSGLYAISVLNFFLGKGFDIIGISMPLVGYNTYPSQVREGNIIYPIHTHDDLFQLHNPFYYFLGRVRSALDYLSGTKGYRKYIMMGLSGGGWTTTLYSAIDTRIWLSFPVAGSIPIPLRTTKKDAGDKEQYFDGFYHKFSYPTLYLLAGAGPHRLTCQILNKKDDCCFAFDGNKYWTGEIRSGLAVLGEKTHYEFYQDPFAPFHKVSSMAVHKIYEEIRKAFAREGVSL